jgi:hypothetical protein
MDNELKQALEAMESRIDKRFGEMENRILKRFEQTDERIFDVKTKLLSAFRDWQAPIQTRLRFLP